MLPNVFSYTIIVKGMPEFSDLLGNAEFTELPAA